MALPGHTNLARHDLYGLRPRPRPQQQHSRAFNHVINGDRENFLNSQLSRRTTLISRSRLPVTVTTVRPVTPTIIGSSTNNDITTTKTVTNTGHVTSNAGHVTSNARHVTSNAGHVTSVTQTLQNRMASAAVEAAAARSARVNTKRI